MKTNKIVSAFKEFILKSKEMANYFNMVWSVLTSNSGSTEEAGIEFTWISKQMPGSHPKDSRAQFLSFCSKCFQNYLSWQFQQVANLVIIFYFIWISLLESSLCSVMTSTFLHRKSWKWGWKVRLEHLTESYICIASTSIFKLWYHFIVIRLEEVIEIRRIINPARHPLVLPLLVII